MGLEKLNVLFQDAARELGFAAGAKVAAFGAQNNADALSAGNRQAQ